MSENDERVAVNVESLVAQQLRIAVDRQSQAMKNLGHVLVERFVADERFATLAATEARNILPCSLTRQLERLARGDHWQGPACDGRG